MNQQHDLRLDLFARRLSALRLPDGLGHVALAESLSMHEGGLWAGFNKLPKSAAKILRDDCN